jgi:hypothetical protein
VAVLEKDNNGLYTNEWLLGDINTNEIALFELGTHKSKLHRSSKNEWIGGTTGFYWGCNNTKDLALRLETVPSVDGRPANLVFRPSNRDIAWQQLYHKHKGKIGVEFGKEAFTTPPLAASPSLDAKFTTTDLARQLKSWALFGPPLGRAWQPTDEQRRRFPEIKPLVSNPWTILHGSPPDKSPANLVAVDLHHAGDKKIAKPDVKHNDALLNVPAWHGTLLPKSDGDIWLTTAFADYERIVAREKALQAARPDGKLNEADRDELAVALFAHRSNYRSAVRAGADVPLAEIKSDIRRDEWYRIASGKGVLVLHELRRLLGDALFCDCMDSFGRQHAGKRVSMTKFQEHVEKFAGRDLGGFFDAWVRRTGLPPRQNGERAEVSREPAADHAPQVVADSYSESCGGAYSIASFERDFEHSLIVYGTGAEAAANREAADALQKLIRESGSNFTIAVRSDKEVTDAELKANHLLLIGRPDSNAVVKRFASALPIAFGSRSFVVRGKTYAHPLSTVIVAAENPLNQCASLVVLAGLSAESTWHAPAAWRRHSRPSPEVLLLAHGNAPQALVLPKRELAQAVK